MIWLAVLGAFMVVSWIANSWAAQRPLRSAMQYAGLFLYVFAESVIFLPLLGIAKFNRLQFVGQDINVIAAAGITTLVMFAGLTALRLSCRSKDFSFLGEFLGMIDDRRIWR